MMYSFIETKLFSRLTGEYLTDDEYVELQTALAAAPDRGARGPEASESCAGRSLVAASEAASASSTTLRPTKA